MADRSIATNCFRILFIAMNLVFVAMGSVLIGFGGWLLYLGEDSDFDRITGSEIFSGAALLVAAGGVTFILAAIGIIGACGMWRPFLIIYIVLVVVLIALEIAAGILGFIYRDQFTSEIEERMNDVFLDYRSRNDSDFDEEVNDLVAFFQEQFKCCGVNGSLDWLNVFPDIFAADGNQPPRECICDKGESNCQLFNFTYVPEGAFVDQQALYYAWDRGCVTAVEDNLDVFAIVVGVLGFVFGFFEIFGIIVSVCLVVCIFKTKNDTFV